MADICRPMTWSSWPWVVAVVCGRVVPAGTINRPPPPPPPSPPGSRFIDTASWVGTEYTPSSAVNTLWWARFEHYRAEIEAELAGLRGLFKIQVLRVFLHSLAWQAAGAAAFERSLREFLDIAASNNMSVGFVLFGDGWNHGKDLPRKGNVGAELGCVDTECCSAVPGCSNGCWFANPQDHQRGDGSPAALEAAFRPYVESVTAQMVHDSRVRFVEVYNEPCEWYHYAAGICTHFEAATAETLKQLAFGWVKAMAPTQPVISCWNARNNTASDLLEVHLYNSDFGGWNTAVFAEATRGAVVTEAGARWFEGTGADSGSPLTVLNWLGALRRDRSARFVPGVFLAWEAMVGATNTRWMNGPPCVNATPPAPEPPVPWCGLAFPGDLTPVSYTEALALRSYLDGHADPVQAENVYAFDDFLPPASNLTGDVFLSLVGAANITRAQDVLVRGAPQAFLAEASVWPVGASPSSCVGLLLRPSGVGDRDGVLVAICPGNQTVVAERWQGGRRIATLASASLTAGDAVGMAAATPNAWNMLRVIVAEGRDPIRVVINPSGGERPAPSGTLRGLRLQLPRAVLGATGLGGVALVALGPGGGRFDYVSVQAPPQSPRAE